MAGEISQAMNEIEHGLSTKLTAMLRRCNTGALANSANYETCNNGRKLTVVEKSLMSDKNYSWKGSPNAGLVLTILALVSAIALLAVGFN